MFTEVDRLPDVAFCHTPPNAVVPEQLMLCDLCIICIMSNQIDFYHGNMAWSLQIALMIQHSSVAYEFYMLNVEYIKPDMV